jgi:hypothetical protein
VSSRNRFLICQPRRVNLRRKRGYADALPRRGSDTWPVSSSLRSRKATLPKTEVEKRYRNRAEQVEYQRCPRIVSRTKATSYAAPELHRDALGRGASVPRSHRRCRPQARCFNPAGFSFGFGGFGKLLLLRLALGCRWRSRPTKSGGPALFAPSLKLQGDNDAHKQLRVFFRQQLPGVVRMPIGAKVSRIRTEQIFRKCWNLITPSCPPLALAPPRIRRRRSAGPIQPANRGLTSGLP